MRGARGVCAIAAALVLLLHCPARTSAEEGGTDSELPDFKKMRVKDLKALLDERAVECKGCAEKADLVARVMETYHLPVVEKPKEEPKPEAKAADDKEIDELVKKLQREMKMKGGPGFNVFRPGDFKDLTPEQMQEKFNMGGKTEL